MRTALELLIKMANKLDQRGMYEYADRIDLVVLGARDMTKETWDFIDGLKWHLKDAVLNNRFPNITEESVVDMLAVIDIASGERRASPRIGPEFRKEEKEQTLVINPVSLALAARELTESVKKLRAQLDDLQNKASQASDSEEKAKIDKEIEYLKKDLEHDMTSLKQRQYEIKILEEKYPKEYEQFLEVLKTGKY